MNFTMINVKLYFGGRAWAEIIDWGDGGDSIADTQSDGWGPMDNKSEWDNYFISESEYRCHRRRMPHLVTVNGILYRRGDNDFYYAV